MIAHTPVRIVSTVIVAGVLLIGLRAVAGESTPDQRATTTRAVVTGATISRVLDGDTVAVSARTDGDVRVRLLGISAPEVAHSGKAGQCYGVAATRTLRRALPIGTRVTLESDPTQARSDVHGRWLRYVRAAGHDVGAAQIRSGAAAARDSHVQVQRHANYVRVEREAYARGAGLWARCRR